MTANLRTYTHADLICAYTFHSYSILALDNLLREQKIFVVPLVRSFCVDGQGTAVVHFVPHFVDVQNYPKKCLLWSLAHTCLYRYSNTCTLTHTRARSRVSFAYAPSIWLCVHLVLMAEVVAHFFPHFVDVHNYPASNACDKKAYNWQTLNRTLLCVRKVCICRVCLARIRKNTKLMRSVTHVIFCATVFARMSIVSFWWLTFFANLRGYVEWMHCLCTTYKAIFAPI